MQRSCATVVCNSRVHNTPRLLPVLIRLRCGLGSAGLTEHVTRDNGASDATRQHSCLNPSGHMQHVGCVLKHGSDGRGRRRARPHATALGAGLRSNAWAPDSNVARWHPRQRKARCARLSIRQSMSGRAPRLVRSVARKRQSCPGAVAEVRW